MIRRVHIPVCPVCRQRASGWLVDSAAALRLQAEGQRAVVKCQAGHWLHLAGPRGHEVLYVAPAPMEAR